jgi:nicotinamidase-related amidase
MRTALECQLPDGTRRTLPDDEAFELWLEPEHTAIVSIDMHRGHIGPEAQLPCPAPRARDRIPEHNAFHAAARELGVPVIHVQHWQRHGGIDDVTSKIRNRRANWRVLYPLYQPPNELADELNWEGTPWLDLLVEEDPRDLYVRTKKRLSAFYPTDLEFLLHQLDVHNVVFTGTLTDCCVINSAFDAADRDFRVIVPPDITAGLSDEAERHALGIMAMHVGLIVDSPEVVREWAARLDKPIPAGFATARTATEALTETATAA